jgi:hypothetical protein
LLQRGLMGLKVSYAMAFAIRWDSYSPNLPKDGYHIVRYGIAESQRRGDDDGSAARGCVIVSPVENG